MNIREAKNIIYKAESRSYLTPEEEFLMIEAYQYLIEETKDVGCMVGPGGYYYEQKEFERRALIVDDNDNPPVINRRSEKPAKDNEK